MKTRPELHEASSHAFAGASSAMWWPSTRGGGPGAARLSPAVGAVLMSLSTVIVAVNAQLLRRSAICMNGVS
jgi:cation transport ATPase